MPRRAHNATLDSQPQTRSDGIADLTNPGEQDSRLSPAPIPWDTDASPRAEDPGAADLEPDSCPRALPHHSSQATALGTTYVGLALGDCTACSHPCVPHGSTGPPSPPNSRTFLSSWETPGQEQSCSQPPVTTNLLQSPWNCPSWTFQVNDPLDTGCWRQLLLVSKVGGGSSVAWRPHVMTTPSPHRKGGDHQPSGQPQV